ncbi:MAG: hypothetical protein IT481_08510 [Gammaproteobacteria bacterium]|nr:hypothetical protein [Gammaproteobacteria bacterium]
MISLRILLAAALAFLPLAEASAATVQIQVKDQGGTARSFNVVTNTDLTGNLTSTYAVCDGTAAAQCAAVKAASTAAAQTDPALVVRNADVGTTSDAAATTGGTGTLSAKLRQISSQIDTLNTTMQGSIPAGTAIIGNVGVDQTTVGTTNAVSLKYLNTTAIATNSGSKDGGTLRTVLATDQLALATWGHGATGSAPPSGATYISALGSGATGGLTRGLITCDQKATYDASTSGSTEMVALTSGRVVYVCGYVVKVDGAVNVKLVYGTGTNCATSPQNMTPTWKFTAADNGLADQGTFWRGLATASANALCINASGAVGVQAIVYYAII